MTQTLVYHCQQAAEKSLKAFLTWQSEPFRKTHNLKELGDVCATFDPTLRETTDSAHGLTDYAWKLRYPGEPYVIEDGETDAMINLASRIVHDIQVRLHRGGREEADRLADDSEASKLQ